MTTAVTYYPGQGGDSALAIFPSKHAALAFVETNPSSMMHGATYRQQRRQDVVRFLEGGSSLYYYGCELTTNIKEHK